MNKHSKITIEKRVLVGGCFDVLHYGHIQFLSKARSLGTQLIVALESDQNVTKRKGSTRPIHTQKQREQMLKALSVVDTVLLLPPMKSDEDYRNLVIKIKPDVIAVTQGDLFLDQKKQQASLIGAIVKIIPKIHTPSTSQLAKLIGLE